VSVCVVVLGFAFVGVHVRARESECVFESARERGKERACMRERPREGRRE